MATTHDSGTSGEPLGGGSPVSDGSFLLEDGGGFNMWVSGNLLGMGISGQLHIQSGEFGLTIGSDTLLKWLKEKVSELTPAASVPLQV